MEWFVEIYQFDAQTRGFSQNKRKTIKYMSNVWWKLKRKISWIGIYYKKYDCLVYSHNVDCRPHDTFFMDVLGTHVFFLYTDFFLKKEI